MVGSTAAARPANTAIYNRDLSFFMLDSRRVLVGTPPARTKDAGVHSKTHLEFRCCLQAVLIENTCLAGLACVGVECQHERCARCDVVGVYVARLWH